MTWTAWLFASPTSSSVSQKDDPFKDSRIESGVQYVDGDGKPVPFLLRLKDVRKACKDWKTFSSDHPFQVVLHSEEDVRSVRQLPIETDPPEHTDYRKLVEPFFKRPYDSDYQADMKAMIGEEVRRAIRRDGFDAVRELALPIQSRSLARLLGVDDSESTLWISWGTHVFKEGDGVQKGGDLQDYIESKFNESTDPAASDFFSTLNHVEFRGRRLTDEEKYGFANITFAGGRDTIIHTLSSIVHYFGENPDGLDFLRRDPSHIVTAAEEFVRFVSPLTAIMRTCPHAADVADHPVAAGDRVGLCWPSANRDEATFENSNQVKLDRKRNPHVGYGFGIHNCLGAPQARLIIRSCLESISKHVSAIRIHQAIPEFETESSYRRQVGFEKLDVTFESDLDR